MNGSQNVKVLAVLTIVSQSAIILINMLTTISLPQLYKSELTEGQTSILPHMAGSICLSHAEFGHVQYRLASASGFS